jgi:hypothetical protein
VKENICPDSQASREGGRGRARIRDRIRDRARIRGRRQGQGRGQGQEAGIWRAFAICGGDDFDNNLPADGKTRKEAYQ